MSLLFEIIQNCMSPNNILRKNSEKELFKCCDQDFFQVLSQLCNLIVNYNTPNTICLFCGTFIRHIFSIEKYISIWKTFSEDQKNLIKNSLLGCLASENNEKKKTCSIAIAAIATIEINLGWNIIEIICNASFNENINYKITSLITLKNMIDFMGKNLKKEEKQKILGSLTTNMSINEPVQVINEAINAFEKIIPFIEDNFKEENQRNFMIKLLLDILDPNYINKVSLSELMQKNILIDFIEIIKKYCFYLQNIFENIAKMTFRYFNCNNNLLSSLSIELWSTLTDYEIKIKKNIISIDYQDILSENIINSIISRNYSLFEVDEWTPAKASIILLSNLVCIGNKKVLDKMLTFIKNSLNSDLVIKFNNNIQILNDSEKKKALIIKENAFLIYKAILYCKKIDSDTIESSLKEIINELKKVENFPIYNSIAFCLPVICKVHLNIINESQDKFDKFIYEIFQLLEFHMNNKKILNYLLLAFKHIIKNCYQEYFNKHLENILIILLKIAYDKNSYNKDLNIVHSSMVLIEKIIEVCEDNNDNENIIKNFFADVYNKFENSLDEKNFLEKEEQICYQNSILSIISSCCEYQKIKMNKIQIESIFNLIEKCVQQRGCIFEEGILAMSSLSFYKWDLFCFINDNVMKYILFSLEERKDFLLCYQGLLAADEIINCIGKENIVNVNKIIEKMKNIINDENIPRGLKIKCFSLYSDIFMINDESIGDYLNDALQLLINGMNGSIEVPSKDEDEDTLNYIIELREKIVELLSTIFLFLMNQNQVNVLSQYIDGFIKYLSKIVQPEFNCNNELIAAICGILGDMSTYFKSTIGLYFSNYSLKILLDKLQKSDNPQHIEVFNYAKQVLLDLNTNYI